MRERATALLAYKALLPVRFSVDASLALQDIERELLAGQEFMFYCVSLFFFIGLKRNKLFNFCFQYM